MRRRTRANVNNWPNKYFVILKGWLVHDPISKKAGFKISLLNNYLLDLGCRVWVHLLSLEMVKRISIVAIEGKISLLLCPDFRKQVTASTATATASLTYKFIPLGHPILSIRILIEHYGVVMNWIMLTCFDWMHQQAGMTCLFDEARYKVAFLNVDTFS